MIPPFDNLWICAAFGAVIGAAFGSFVTMLVHRLPRRLSIVAPRSHCPSCGQTLGPCDLVPVLSWLALRGRCRSCHAQIGARYVWIELAFALCGGVLAAIIS